MTEQAAKKEHLLQEFLHDLSNLIVKVQRNSEKLRSQERFANDPDLNLLYNNVDICINRISDFKRLFRELEE